MILFKPLKLLLRLDEYIKTLSYTTTIPIQTNSSEFILETITTIYNLSFLLTTFSLDIQYIISYILINIHHYFQISIT